MNDMQAFFTRREMLRRMGSGFGTVGLAGAMQASGLLNPSAAEGAVRATHFPAKAKRVVFLFMNGAPSHVDTFDPKPALKKHEGEQPQGEKYRKTKGNGYMPSPFRFRPHGESGVVMSELFPNLSQFADDLCVLRSMHTNVPNHEPGLLIMQSGVQQPTRPCLGSWASYGLGSENENLPGFVVLCPGMPVVGPQLWSSAFLPGEHQGTVVDVNDLRVDKLVANIRHPRLNRDQQRRQLDLLGQLNRLHLEQRGQDAKLEAHIKSMELAFNMQREASVAFDVSKEPEHVRENYGKSTFGNSCLLARRLLEHGVRFVQVYYVSKGGKQPWDSHSDNNGRQRSLCADSDRATAALLGDLKSRGLLDDTLVVWGGEFGRTPMVEASAALGRSMGRDHHPQAFTMW
ncbi:MAG: DUF1501 domain-containing protein, partial [Planctomycetales bacterium]